MAKRTIVTKPRNHPSGLSGEGDYGASEDDHAASESVYLNIDVSASPCPNLEM